MSESIFYSDATKLADMIRSREVSAVEVVKAHLDRIQAVDPQINAIVTLTDDVLEKAEAADAAVRAGDELGVLHGVPFTVKDSIDTAGVLTQRGSPIFKGRTPDADATSVARMKRAGGILLAKTNLPEFSYWIESDNLLTGRSNNPWDVTRTPGGSSGGESAAIAAGMSPIGLGTDLAISVRGPAAQTGISSIKATHGRVPMTGIYPRAPRRFWHVGPMARSIRDLALAFSQLAGPDGRSRRARLSSTPESVASPIGSFGSAGWSNRASGQSTRKWPRWSRRRPTRSRALACMSSPSEFRRSRETSRSMCSIGST
jgi:aspartyl-tRNA(Asn)/glutamyl-tRNA(Gln) amidotransferase subunit A